MSFRQDKQIKEHVNKYTFSLTSVEIDFRVEAPKWDYHVRRHQDKVCITDSQIHPFCQCFCLPPLSRLSTVDCVVEYIRTVGGSAITAERWPGKTHSSHIYILYGHTLQCAHFGKIHTIHRCHIRTYEYTQTCTKPWPKNNKRVPHWEFTANGEKPSSFLSRVWLCRELCHTYFPTFLSVFLHRSHDSLFGRVGPNETVLLKHVGSHLVNNVIIFEKEVQIS